MKLNFDFTTHQSLGNVHNNITKDNFKSFENAKTLIKSSNYNIENSIIEGFEKYGVTNGTKITIPVGHHSNAGFIDNLEFEVTAVNGNEVNLALTNVNHKTPKTK